MEVLLSTHTTLPHSRLLRGALRTNAAFSIVTGLGLLVAPDAVAAWIGVSLPWVLRVIGAGLLIFAADLLHQDALPSLDPRRALGSTLGDLGWVLGTGALLLGWPDVVNGTGVIVLLAVADVVLCCGVAQALGLRRLSRAAATA